MEKIELRQAKPQIDDGNNFGTTENLMIYKFFQNVYTFAFLLIRANKKLSE